MILTLKHTQTGVVKQCKIGFSWTYFFFGPMVAIFRGMWAPLVVSMLSFGIANLYYMFVINKKYTEMLLEKGYQPVSEIDRQRIVQMGLLT